MFAYSGYLSKVDMTKHAISCTCNDYSRKYIDAIGLLALVEVVALEFQLL